MGLLKTMLFIFLLSLGGSCFLGAVSLNSSPDRDRNSKTSPFILVVISFILFAVVFLMMGIDIQMLNEK